MSVRGTIRCAVDLWPVPGGSATALAIAARESNFIRWAVSPSGHHLGIYQIWDEHLPTWPNAVMRLPYWERWFPNLDRNDRNMLFNARFNVFLAIRVAHSGGWGPWE